MTLPYPRVFPIRSIHSNIRAEAEEFTSLIFDTWACSCVEIYLYVHILQLHLRISREHGSECFCERLKEAYTPKRPRGSLHLKSDVLGYIEYDMVVTFRKNLPGKKEQSLLHKLFRKSLQTFIIREPLLFYTRLLIEQHIAVLVFDSEDNILFVNHDGSSILSEQTEDLLVLPREDGKFVAFLTYLSSLTAGMKEQNVFLTTGKQYNVSVLGLNDGFLGELRLVILQELLPFDPEALMIYLKNLGLTRRERELSAHLLQGLSNQQIAEKMGISYLTVKDHLTNMFRKLGVATRNQFICSLLGVRQSIHQDEGVSDTV